MTDPWTWTVEDVTANFCRGGSWGSRPETPHPDAAVIEQAFRDNLVDGPTLLDQISAQALKDEFEIKAFGTRAAIVRAIERLRDTSPRYVDHRASIEIVQRRVKARASEASPAATPRHGTPGLPVAPSVEVKASPVPSEAFRLTPARTEENSSPKTASHQVTADGRKRRRIQPTILTAAPTSRRIWDDTYLGRSKSKLDDVFYGHALDSSDGEEFQVEQTAAPRGQRTFVKQRVHHLLRSQPAFEGSSRAILLPYPDRLVKEGNARSATVFTATNGTASAVRGNALLLNTSLEEHPESAEQNTNWDYLAKWAQSAENDEVLPLYAESGSENDYNDSLLDEMERDQAEETSVSQYLSQEEVQATLDEAIQELRETWRDEKLPRRKHHAHKIWQNARGRKAAAVADGIRRRLDHKELRLQTLVREMLGQQWRSKTQLWKQRGSLEATVFDIEEARWQLNIISGPAPPRMPRNYARRAPPAARIADEESGDLIESSSSESDEDFVEVEEYPTLDEAPPLEEQLVKDEPIIEDGHPVLDDDMVNGKEATASRKSSISDDSVLGPPSRVTHPIKRQSSPMTPFQQGETIDLTASSQPEPETAEQAVMIDYSRAPESATELEISKWPWTVLLENCDRKRIILKLLSGMEPAQRKRIEAQFFDFEHDRLLEDTGKALKALRAKRNIIGSIDSSSSRTEAMFRVARLWTCWTEASNAYIVDDIHDDILEVTMQFEDFDSFWNFLRTIIKTGDPSETEDEDPVTPRKKRTVIKDRQAQQMRQQAHDRARLGVAREMEYKLNTHGSGIDHDHIPPIVNMLREDDEDPIFLHPHIAKRIKPHQLKGIQFMWREVVTSDAGLKQGCLLAHAMGLGKTMQTIALLVTIQIAAQSTKKRIQRQLPRELRRNRTLILCPAVLIDNWRDEFAFWLPSDEPTIRPICPINAKMDFKDRLATIAQWHATGGVLILSYDMFKRLLSSRPKGRLSGLTDEEREELHEQLLAGPSIIVADEAHALKNSSSQIGGLVKQFQSTSRIALTGSPLANNLGEYYAMIDWVAPGYLGDPEEFRALYQHPIEEGTWEDASPYEQRRSLKKLKVLTTDIEPKVDRADITVLKDELTPKTEFVLYLATTDHQRRSYAAFVDSVRTLHREQSSNMSVFDWMRLLGSLLNHPSLLLSKLQTRAKGATAPTTIKKSKKDKTADTEVEQADQDSQEAPQNLDDNLSGRLLAQQLTIDDKEGIENPKDPSLSIKAEVITRILTESKAVGDQVLVFSHQIPMLDYLEFQIPQLPGRIRIDRLDGTTPMDKRLGKIKAFNAGNSDVFLLSTRAAALGLNIASANRVILVDFEFNPSHEEQAVGRAYRIGQTKEVFVYHLVTSGTFERKLHDLTIFKQQLALRILDSRNPNRAASKIDTYLFPPQEVEQQDLHDHRNKDIVLDSILDSEAGAFIRDINTAETMHAEKEEKFTEEEEKEIRELIADDKLRKRDHAAWSKKQIDQLKMRPADAARTPPQQAASLANATAIASGPSPRQAFTTARAPVAPVQDPKTTFDVGTGRTLLSHHQHQQRPTGIGGRGVPSTSSINAPSWLDAPDIANPPIRGPHQMATQRGAPTHARSRTANQQHLTRPAPLRSAISTLHRQQPTAEDSYDGPYPPGARQVNAGFGSVHPSILQARMLDDEAAEQARQEFKRRQKINSDAAAAKRQDEARGKSVGDAIDLDSD